MARISSGFETTSRLGNLDSERDFGYAGDYVEAMWRMLQREDPGDFIVASGQTWSVRQILDICFGLIGIDDWSGYVTTDDRFLRPSDVDHLVGDATLAREVLHRDRRSASPTSWERWSKVTSRRKVAGDTRLIQSADGRTRKAHSAACQGVRRPGQR